MKELHIWLDKIGMCFVGENVYTNYMETERALERDEDVIHTTVTHFCNFRYNRRLLVHVNNTVHEITLGETEGTDKVIRKEHNLERLLLTGLFDWFDGIII